MRKLLSLLFIPFLLPISAQDDVFEGSFTMQMHTYEKGKENKDSPMHMKFWSSEDMILVQPILKEKSGEDMKMLTDLKNDVQYTLIDDGKGGKMAMKMPKVNMPDAKGTDADDDDDMNVERTGNTKMIDGIECHEYKGSNEEGTWTAWVAEDMKAPFERFAQAMAGNGGKQKKKNAKGPKDLPEGIPMESTWESADGKEKVVMYIKELKTGEVDESVFDISGYEVMDIPMMPGMPGAGQ